MDTAVASQPHEEPVTAENLLAALEASALGAKVEDDLSESPVRRALVRLH